jgi:hypothetical protein
VERRCPSLRVIVLVAASSGCGGCGSCRAVPAGSAPDAGGQLEAAAARDSGLAPARCEVTAAAPLDADGEVGEAVAIPSGFAIAITRRVSGQRSASVGIVNHGLNDVAYVDLGPVYGDDPLPRPFVRGDDLLVAHYARSRDAGAVRELRVFRVANKSATLTASFAQPLDDSLSYDVALAEGGGLVAWDEDGAPANAGVSRPGRGAIKVAALSPSLEPAGTPPYGIVASPERSDAESPRLTPRPGGYWLVWIARLAEASASESDAAPDARPVVLEGPGEARTFQWLEAAPLDASGVRVGEVRKLTPASGHVTMFELAPLGADLDVFYRDDAETSEGVGGRIVRVRTRFDGVDAPVELARSGAGRGAPDLVGAGLGAAFSWLAYVDVADHGMLLPLGKLHDPAGLPSEEPSLFEGRLVAASKREGGGLLAVSARGDKRLEAKTLRCAR